MEKASQNDPERPFRVGDVLAGKYRIERVLGEGGMGVVVAATHLQLDQVVAMKFVLPSMLESETVVERFLREARAAVRLKSEHAAKVLDVGTLESGVPYMVMEYLEGSDLARVLQEFGPLPIDVAADYIIQACEAVAEAHVRGIVHRDLKPQNLFLTTGVGGVPLVKVLDFGISKMSGDVSSGLTQTKITMGSPLYMAPEQMRSSRSVDGRADVWALGVVLYRLVSGALPFTADQMPELCFKVVNDPPRPLTEVKPDIPAEFAAVVTRCLEKEPDKRFATAGDLAHALEAFAPASASRVVERARSLGQGARPSMLSIPPQGGAAHGAEAPSPLAPNMNGRQGTEPLPTISSWGDTKGGARSDRRSYMFALVAAVSIAAGALLGYRTLRAPAAPVAPSPTQASAITTTTIASAAVQAQPAALAQPATAAPPPELSAQHAPSIAPSAKPIALVASAAASVNAPVSPPPSHAKPTASALTHPPSKPTLHSSADDDIPSMR